MKKTMIIIGLFVSVLILGLLISRIQGQKYPSSQLPSYSSIGGDFELEGLNGQKINLKSFRGKYVVMYLGFTHCPDICPTAMSTLSKVISRLDKKSRTQVQAFFVSVDYQRDTGDIVDSYIKYYIDNGVGASGTKEQIDSLVKSYAAYYKLNKDKGSALEYSIDHTSRFYILSKTGKLIDSVSDSETIDIILERLLSAMAKK